MPPRLRAPRRRAAVLLGVLALAAGPVSCGSQSAAPQDRPGCVSLKGLREEQLGEVAGPLDGASPAPGDSGVYLRRLYGAGTEPVATVYGKGGVQQRLSDGHLLAYADERIEFADGTVQARGFYDLTDAAAGAAQYIPTIGSTGVFRDKAGRITFRAVRPGREFSAEIEMCPTGMFR
ncbi:allene oxide cyclase barrel-like domain-containing protein [Kitasatospora aureofaciens]|uniref:allene oxide cyclase barrel-like domain-containing protein n=1 Tax=Kitasatospora aureofaciens TaxID=1894 RepID=UPI0037CACCFF